MARQLVKKKKVLGRVENLNIFREHPETKMTFIQTLTEEIEIGTIPLIDNTLEPLHSLSDKFKNLCQHDYEHVGCIQIRAGDEIPTLTEKCKKCGVLKIT